MNLHNDLKDNHGQLEHLHSHTHTHTLSHSHYSYSQKILHLLSSSKYYSQINNLKSKHVHIIELQFQTSTAGPPALVPYQHQFHTRITGPPAAHSHGTSTVPG
jgi:hypothetical protein